MGMGEHRAMPSAVTVHADHTGGALWDRSPGMSSMERVDPLRLGLSGQLGDELQRWSEAWGPLSLTYIYDDVPVDVAGEAAHRAEGARLARAVKQELLERGRGDITVYFGGHEVEPD